MYTNTIPVFSVSPYRNEREKKKWYAPSCGLHVRYGMNPTDTNSRHRYEFGMHLLQNCSIFYEFFFFDFCSFSVTYLEEISGGSKKSGGSATLGSIKILRVFRVLRPLRAINRAKGLKVILFV